jgi:molecular chaperone DnaJ
LAKKDYYEVLGVSNGSSGDDIKKAYRKLAIQNHPDRNPGDKRAEERFKEATEAYEVLANAEKRQAYDQFGFAGVDGFGGSGAHDFTSVFRDFEDIFGDFSGFFDSFFGGGGRRRHSGRSSVRRGADLRYDLEIDFIQAAFGAKIDISYMRNDTCSLCRGSGSDSGSGKKVCGTCSGSGQVRRSSGFFSIATTCPTCSGEGEIIENPCQECGGTGLVRENRKIKVSIPSGIESGKRINIPGQGDAGPGGGPAGNIYAYIRVKPHICFERDGFDIYCVIPISITQAALGDDIFVSTLDDKKIKVKIPGGTQNGKVLRLRSEGIPHMNNHNLRGDLYIKIQVVIPTKLSSRGKTLLKDFAGLNGGENSSPNPVPLSELR